MLDIFAQSVGRAMFIADRYSRIGPSLSTDASSFFLSLLLLFCPYLAKLLRSIQCKSAQHAYQVPLLGRHTICFWNNRAPRQIYLQFLAFFDGEGIIFLFLLEQKKHVKDHLILTT